MNPKLDGEKMDIDGIPTFVVRRGQGPAVILIHGASPGACTSVNWKPNLEPLASAGFAVVGYDQPGFGHTGHPTDFSMEYRVAHARALLDALGLDRFHLVGNSMGAYIAARIALDDPRVDRLVLVSSSALAPQVSEASAARARRHAQELRDFEPSLEAMRAMTLKTLHDPSLVTEELVRERHEMSIGPRHDAHVKRRSAPRPRPITDELRRLRTPALILWGRDDQGAAVERGLALFQLIPHAEFHAFDRCGHWVQWDQADRFNRMVTAFLRKD
jgi:2-hydroxy-6-oxonona-2,4-dienedioate hydrolase